MKTTTVGRMSTARTAVPLIMRMTRFRAHPVKIVVG
jgi:hypothetical protein